MSTQLLHQGLVEDGYYSGTVQQFQSDYSGKEDQLELYNGIVGDGDFSGSFIDFQNQYFPTQAAVTTPTSTTRTTSTSTYTPKKNEYVFGDKTEEEVSYESILGEDWENKIKKAQKVQDTKQFFVLPNKKYFNKDGSLKTPEEMLGDKKPEGFHIPTLEEIVKNNREETKRNNIIKSQKIIKETQKGLDDLEKEKNNLIIEKNSIPEVPTKKQEKRLKEINSRLNKISELREEQKDIAKEAKQDK